MRVSLHAHRALCIFTITALALPAAAQGVRGPEWVEGSRRTGDAGSLPQDAQNTQGTGPMMGIQGQLELGFNGPGDFEDMYRITIEDPDAFAVEVLFGKGGANFDTSLWLFQEITFGKGGPFALGLLANQDLGPNELGSGFQNFATDGTENMVQEPGIYWLAITRQGNVPQSDGEIFFFNAKSPFEVSGNDGQGGPFPISGWSGDDGLQPGVASYRIELHGTGFADVPAPGVIPAIALGALGFSRRRRSRD